MTLKIYAFNIGWFPYDRLFAICGLTLNVTLFAHGLLASAFKSTRNDSQRSHGDQLLVV